jgi:hypothetical protein
VTSEVLQELDFSQCPLGDNPLAQNVCKFLDSDPFAGVTVGRSTIKSDISLVPSTAWAEGRDAGKVHRREYHVPNNAISALSQLFGHIVSFIHDEILIEHLEIFEILSAGKI